MNFLTANKYLSTLLFVLILIGYQLVTTAFLPNFSTDEGIETNVTVSRMVTVPYRALILALSSAVIILNWRRWTLVNIPLRLYFVVWVLLSVRIVYDLLIRTDVVIDPSVVQNQFLYTFLVCLIPTFAIYKSVRCIDFDLAEKYIFLALVLILILLVYKNPELFTTVDLGVRINGNVATNSISFGQFGAVLALFGLYSLRRKGWDLYKFLGVLFFLAGIFVVLRSGSRGPLVAILGSVLFYVVATQKNPAMAFTVFLVFVCLVFVMSDFLHEMISRISPVMAQRMSLSGNVSQYEELSSGRIILYSTAVDKFLNHPLLGDSYALISPDGTIWYSHNMVLDAFMALGLFGGLLFVTLLLCVIWYSYKLIHYENKYCWIGVLFICYLIRHMFSGAFYQADALNVLLVVILSNSWKLDFHSSRIIECYNLNITH